MLETEFRLTPDLVDKIRIWSERVFAEACAGKPNLVVTCQIPVGTSLIDFRVVNTSHPNSNGILVEVTGLSEEVVFNVQNKLNQMDNMERSGLPHIILTREHLRRIQRNGKETKRK